MNSRWQVCSLDDVAIVGAGNPAPQDPRFFDRGNHPFFRTSDVGKVHIGELSVASDLLNDEGAKGLKRYPAGTILLPKSGASTFVDHRVVMAVDGFVSSHLATILAREDRMDGRFLFYALLNIRARDIATDTSYPTLSLKQIKEIRISCPTLEEQRRIVAILDEAFEGIAAATANAEKNLANARQLFELERDVLVSNGGPDWIEAPLGTVCDTQYGISGSMNTEGKGYRIFRMGEVQDGRMVDTGTMKYIDISEREFEPYRLRKGDILFNRTNSIALVGKTGMFSLEGPYCFASYLIRVNFNPGQMSSRFACYMMNSRPFLDKIRSKAAQSVNQANINATILRNERVLYPRDVAKQEELADKLDELRQQSEDLTNLYEVKLALLIELRQSILHHTFNGDLTMALAA